MLYKKKHPNNPEFPELSITGYEICKQLGPGSAQCEQETLGIVLEEWKRMEVYNTEEKIILPTSFANVSF